MSTCRYNSCYGLKLRNPVQRRVSVSYWSHVAWPTYALFCLVPLCIVNNHNKDTENKRASVWASFSSQSHDLGTLYGAFVSRGPIVSTSDSSYSSDLGEGDFIWVAGPSFGCNPPPRLGLKLSVVFLITVFMSIVCQLSSPPGNGVLSCVSRIHGVQTWLKLKGLSKVSFFGCPIL